MGVWENGISQKRKIGKLKKLIAYYTIFLGVACFLRLYKINKSIFYFVMEVIQLFKFIFR
jgi:cytochrome c-type biogenesis protein CcmE